MKYKIKSNLLRTLNKGLIGGLIVSAISFFFPIIPCTKSQVIAELKYEFGLCKLPNPFGENLVGISQKFYNYSTDPLAGLIMQFIVSVLLITLIFRLFKRKKQKVLDLTRNK